MPPSGNLNKRTLWGSLWLPSQETIEVCHPLLQSPNFFRLLLRMDEKLPSQTHAAGCRRGGVLHRANYPRKPRACLRGIRNHCAARFSFRCHRCRRRTTLMSLRFLGRRAYLALAVVLGSARNPQRPAIDPSTLASRLPIDPLTWRTCPVGTFSMFTHHLTNFLRDWLIESRSKTFA